MSRPRLIALLLAFTTLLVYLPVAQHDFINYDDPDYVTDNPVVKAGLTLGGLKWAFIGGHASNWHPLTWISHMLDCELFGLNAGAQHLVNVLFHAANSALLFVWLWRLTQKLWPSTLVAALFAWHPLHVESVAWIAERKDVLSTFFALLSLLAYIKYVGDAKTKNPKPKTYYTLSLLAFTLGLLAKPMVVTLPFVMLLLDFWPLERIKNSGLKIENWKPLLAEKIPFFLLAAISCAFTFFAQKNGGAVASLTTVPLPDRLENAPIAIMRYGLKLFWPTNLAVYYPLAAISLVTLAAALAVLFFISAVAWHCRKTKPYLLFGWLWFLGTLMPVIGLVQVGGQSMADRYTYIPSIGFFVAVVFLAADFARQIQMPKIIAASGSALILSACILLTEFQLSFWGDSEILFRHALAITKNNDVAHLNLGLTLELQGDITNAVAEYQETLRLNPRYPELHNNLGGIFDKLGLHEQSLAEYRIAVQLRPNSAFLHNAAGSELAALGQYPDALKEFSEAERLDPKYSAPHLEQAKVFYKLGRDAEGAREFQTALALEPDNFKILAIAARYFAADENATASDHQTALVLATKANDLTSQSQPMVWDVQAMAYAANDDFSNALASVQTAIDLATAAQMKNLPELQQRLKLYQSHQPWRESFRDTNTPTK